ncbi:MAG: hypothetical protein HC794_09625 [Nitrospiraceae bacterium]|nr:hypothetical protein [Nitrospiraceae bacterium]
MAVRSRFTTSSPSSLRSSRAHSTSGELFMKFTFVDLWNAMGPVAKGVVILLVLLSIWSLYVIVERMLHYRKARNESLSLAKEVTNLLKADRADDHHRQVAQSLQLVPRGLGVDEPLVDVAHQARGDHHQVAADGAQQDEERHRHPHVGDKVQAGDEHAHGDEEHEQAELLVRVLERVGERLHGSPVRVDDAGQPPGQVIAVGRVNSIRPLDADTILASVRKTNRIVSVEEGWPFAGIGSEGVVALRHGRRFVGIELKPAYYRVAVGAPGGSGRRRISLRARASPRSSSR